MRNATIHESSFIETSPTRTTSVQPAWSGVHTSPFLNSFEGRTPSPHFLFSQREQSHNDMTLFSDASLPTRYLPSSSPTHITHSLRLTNFKSRFPHKIEKDFYEGGKKEIKFISWLVYFWKFQESSLFQFVCGLLEYPLNVPPSPSFDIDVFYCLCSQMRHLRFPKRHHTFAEPLVHFSPALTCQQKGADVS